MYECCESTMRCVSERAEFYKMGEHLRLRTFVVLGTSNASLNF